MDALLKEVQLKISHTSLFNKLNPNAIFTLGSHDNEVYLSIFLWDDSEMHEVFGPIAFNEFGEPESLEGAILIIEDEIHAPKPELKLTLEVKGRVFTMCHDPNFIGDIIIPRTETYGEIEKEVNAEAEKVMAEADNSPLVAEFINIEDDTNYLHHLDRKESATDEEETDEHQRR